MLLNFNHKRNNSFYFKKNIHFRNRKYSYSKQKLKKIFDFFFCVLSKALFETLYLNFRTEFFCNFCGLNEFLLLVSLTKIYR